MNVMFELLASCVPFHARRSRVICCWHKTTTTDRAVSMKFVSPSPSLSTMTTSNRDLLAHWRSIAARRSLDVLDIAPAALKARGLGEEEWAIREQLAFAALDMGAMGLAEVRTFLTFSRLMSRSVGIGEAKS